MTKFYYFALICASLFSFVACESNDDDVDIKGCWNIDPNNGIIVDITNGKDAFIHSGDDTLASISEAKKLIEDCIMENLSLESLETIEFGEKDTLKINGESISIVTYSCSGNRCYFKPSAESLEEMQEIPSFITTFLNKGIPLEANRTGNNLTLTLSKAYLQKLLDLFTDEHIESLVKQNMEGSSEERISEEITTLKEGVKVANDISKNLKTAELTIKFNKLD